MLMSAGLMMNPFVKTGMDICHTYPSNSAELMASNTTAPSDLKWSLKKHPKTGGLMVDDRFRVKLVPTQPPSSSQPQSKAETSSATEASVNDVFALGDVAVMEKSMLPATAQVANQEAKWLAKRLNAGDLEDETFTFRNLGIMTYVGGMRAIMQTGGEREIKG